jgi:putative phosphoribosyl transferase
MAIDVHTNEATLAGALMFPPGTRAIVVFARTGRGPRLGLDGAVVDALRQAGLATLLVEMLTTEEAADQVRAARVLSDVGLLGERLVGAIDWLGSEAVVGDLPPNLRDLPLGCLGTAEGTGAALVAAADRPDRVTTVVACGGRPDLAREALPRVSVPTLLIAGGADPQVVRLARHAQCLLNGESSLEVIPGADQRLDDAAAVESVVALARDWFARRLAAGWICDQRAG